MDEIKSEVLAEELSFDNAKGYTKEWNLNGEEVTLGVERV
jgi:isoleucyl-tRNA synthetase